MSCGGFIVSEKTSSGREPRETPGSLPDYALSPNGDIKWEDAVPVDVDRRFVARGAALGGATITVFVLAARSALWQALRGTKGNEPQNSLNLSPLSLLSSFYTLAKPVGKLTKCGKTTS